MAFVDIQSSLPVLNIGVTVMYSSYKTFVLYCNVLQSSLFDQIRAPVYYLGISTLRASL